LGCILRWGPVMDDIGRREAQEKRIATALRQLPGGCELDERLIKACAWRLNGIYDNEGLWMHEGGVRDAQEKLLAVATKANELSLAIGALPSEAIEAIFEVENVDRVALGKALGKKSLHKVLIISSNVEMEYAPGEPQDLPADVYEAAQSIPHLKPLLMTHLPNLISAARASEKLLMKKYPIGTDTKPRNAALEKKLMITRWAYHTFKDLVGKKPTYGSTKKLTDFEAFLEKLWEAFELPPASRGTGAKYFAKKVITKLKVEGVV
jgi:hypothetical protein